MHASTSLTVLTLVAIISALATYHISRKRTSTPPRRPQGFVVNTKVTHSRLLPESAAHNFSYPTLFLLVSLRALEAGRLDLCRGWLFSYGGLYGRVTGLRASAYLQEDPTNNVWQKLGKVLTDHGANADELGDAWMLTMPSYFGFEGINPLTVYFCYKTGGEPSVVVLEVSTLSLPCPAKCASNGRRSTIRSERSTCTCCKSVAQRTRNLTEGESLQHLT